MKNKEMRKWEWFFDFEWYEVMLFCVFSTFLAPLKIGVSLDRYFFLVFGLLVDGRI